MTFEAQAGRCVADKYELLRLLGRGAMGEVWLARHKSLNEEVALKILKIDMDAPVETSTWRARFQFEAQVAARLSRKTRNIVQVTDHGEDDGASYLVMERLVGESLGARLDTCIPFAMVQGIVAQVARGLAHAHREGVIHRDLKAENIFLTKDEDAHLLVKILDFGIARPSQKDRTFSPSSTGYGTVLGTPTYMSPEQSQGLASLDQRADLWALAVVAYDALTGSPPFVGSTAEEIIVSICLGRRLPITTSRPDLGIDVERFFQHAFADRLADRFQTAEELAEAFDALVVHETDARTQTDKSSRGEALTLDSPAARPRLEKSSRRRSIGLAVAAVSACAGVALGLVAMRRLRADVPAPSTVAAAAAADVPATHVLIPAAQSVTAVPLAVPPGSPTVPIALAPTVTTTSRLAPHHDPALSSSNAPSAPPPATTKARVNPSDVF